MSIALRLSLLTLKQVISGACATVGIETNATVKFLADRFVDQGDRLNTALQAANDKAWRTLEIALTGDSLWERCKNLTARAEERAFAQQLRAFLDVAPLPEKANGAAFRKECLQELRAARKANLLNASVEPRQLAEQAGGLARLAEKQNQLDAEWQAVLELCKALSEAGYRKLGGLLSLRPQQGDTLLVAASRYYFNRAIEDDPKLFQGLSFAKLEALGTAQEQGFAALSSVLTQQGATLEGLLLDVQGVVEQTHDVVLNLQQQMAGQSQHLQQLAQAVQDLLGQRQMQTREVRPGDSLSIRNDGERQLIKQLVARYRSLPEQERQTTPALLNAIGKLEVVAGDFDAAQRDFQTVATLVDDSEIRAEAYFNAYQAALERRDMTGAMRELLAAIKLDATRYAPFPVGKYTPMRILGAGGFGTAFLCRHRYMNADVVVKTIRVDGLGRDAEAVFTEATVLRNLDHPAIIRISECGYCEPAAKSRPFIIMDYFEGETLEDHVRKHGVLQVPDLLAVSKLVAEGLCAAHGARILHRDVKPANLLVRREGQGWKVKIIDFGLAMTQEAARLSQSGDTDRARQTLMGASIAGTLEYAAPEQMGRRNEPTGPYSDVYAWAKTCCYARFQTTQLLRSHWNQLPEGLAELLEKCLADDPRQRPANMEEVLKGLSNLSGSGKAGADVPFAKPHVVTPVERDRPAQTWPEAGQVERERSKPGLPRKNKRRRSRSSGDIPVWAWVAGGVGVAALLALVLVFSLPRSGAKPPRGGTSTPVSRPPDDDPPANPLVKVDAAEEKKKLVGTWKVKLGLSYDTELTFQEDGVVVCHRMNQSGKWEIDTAKQKVLIRWNEEQWETITLPLNPKGSTGRTWNTHLRTLRAEKIR